ncbi:hypothetical protein RIF29_48394 [Crotalaria pallida]|uniref:Uncharacterized protein n=1 Tax=Crotalaria pallida TaxID=3830 RepID=A0AAN9DRB6_CROPI
MPDALWFLNREVAWSRTKTCYMGIVAVSNAFSYTKEARCCDEHGLGFIPSRGNSTREARAEPFTYPSVYRQSLPFVAGANTNTMIGKPKANETFRPLQQRSKGFTITIFEFFVPHQQPIAGAAGVEGLTLEAANANTASAQSV